MIQSTKLVLSQTKLSSYTIQNQQLENEHVLCSERNSYKFAALKKGSLVQHQRELVCQLK